MSETPDRSTPPNLSAKASDPAHSTTAGPQVAPPSAAVSRTKQHRPPHRCVSPKRTPHARPTTRPTPRKLRLHPSPWRNWIALPSSKWVVGGSSPPGDAWRRVSITLASNARSETKQPRRSGSPGLTQSSHVDGCTSGARPLPPHPLLPIFGALARIGLLITPGLKAGPAGLAVGAAAFGVGRRCGAG